MPPVLDPEPMLPEVPVLEPVEPLLVEPLPSEPVLPEVLPEVPPAPAPVALEPCSLRHCSFCVPVSESQRVEPVLLLDPTEGEGVLLDPAEGELVLLLPMPLAPVLPLVLLGLCAKAPDMANSAAAVAETTSLRFICAPLGGWNEFELQPQGTQGPCREWRLLRAALAAPRDGAPRATPLIPRPRPSGRA